MAEEGPKTGLVGKYPEVMQYDRTYREITASGVIGEFPFAASQEKGEQMVGKFLDRLVEAFLKEWS